MTGRWSWPGDSRVRGPLRQGAAEQLEDGGARYGHPGIYNVPKHVNPHQTEKHDGWTALPDAGSPGWGRSEWSRITFDEQGVVALSVARIDLAIHFLLALTDIRRSI